MDAEDPETKDGVVSILLRVVDRNGTEAIVLLGNSTRYSSTKNEYICHDFSSQGRGA